MWGRPVYCEVDLTFELNDTISYLRNTLQDGSK